MKIDDDGGFWNGWEVFLEDEERNRLPEHKIVHQPPRGDAPGKVAFYIECEGEKEFAIVVARHPQSSFEAGIIYEVDGRMLPFKAVREGCAHRRVRNVPDLHDGTVVYRSLKFSQLDMSDRDQGLTSAAIERLGTITVRLAPVKVLNKGQTTTPPSIPSAPTTSVDEKLKRDLQLYVEGGTISHKWRPSNGFVLRSLPGPNYEFTITYRTRALLMAHGIIPNPNQASQTMTETVPASSPAPTYVSDVEEEKPSLTGDDSKKRERWFTPTALSNRPAKRVKKVWVPGHFIEVVDLTAEDDA